MGIVRGMSSITIRLKHHWFAVAFILGVVLWLTRNFFSAEYPAGTDMLGWVERPDWFAASLKAFSLWDDRFLGAVRFVTLESLLGLASKIVGDPLVTLKLSIMASLAFAGFSMYLLVYWYSKRRLAGMVAAFIFIGNQFIMSQVVQGHLDFAIGYSLLPILVFVFYKATSEGRVGFAILLGMVVAFYYVFTRVDLLVHLAILLGILSVFELIYASNKMVQVMCLSKAAGISLVAFLSFTALQLLPMLLRVTPIWVSTTFTFSIAELQKGALEIGNNVLGLAQEPGYLGMIGQTWTVKHPFLSPYTYYRFMLVIPLLAILALFFKAEKRVVAFIVVAATGLIMATGSHPPFGDLFVWMFNNVPFMGGLRQASRLMTLVYLSYAFLGGVAISEMLGFLERVNWRMLWKRVAYGGVGVVMALAMLSITFASWYPFSRGLLTWAPDQDEIAPYQQLAQEEGDFLVATVPWSRGYMVVVTPRERYSLPGTGERVEHDIGASSALWSKKSPVMQDASHVWNPYARRFIDYTGEMVRTKGTDNLMQVLGTFNTKYLVIQGYEENQPEWASGMTNKASPGFFRDQKGLEKVASFGNAQDKSFGGATLYRNQYWVPHIFGTSKSAVIIGGFEAFTMMTTVENFDLSQWSLFFADQVAKLADTQTLTRTIDNADALIFVNTEPLDLAMLYVEGNISLKPLDYARPSATPDDADKEWVAFDQYNYEGKLVFNPAVMRTSSQVPMAMKLEVKDAGSYELWARVAFNNNRGELDFELDGAKVGSIIPWTPHNSGLKWAKIGTVELNQGIHQLMLLNRPSEKGGISEVDEITLVKPEALQAALASVEQIATRDSLRKVFFFEGEQLFKWAEQQPELWKRKDTPYWSGGTALVAKQPEQFQLSYPLPTDKYQALARALRALETSGIETAIDGRPVFKADLGVIRETAVVYTGSADFWQNFNPAQVALSVEASSSNNPSDAVLKIDATRPGRQFFGMLSRKFDTPQDWSQDKALVLDFKGSARGAGFSLDVYFDGSRDNAATFSFVGDTQDWERLFFQKLSPTKTSGRIDWQKVTEIGLSMSDKNTTGTFYLGRLSRADYDAESALQQIDSAPFDVSGNNHSITLRNEGEVQLDQLAFYSVSPEEKGITFEDIFRTKKEGSPVVTYEKKSPTRYIAHVKTSSPFYLTFSDSYHNGWRAYVGKEEIRPIITDSFVNGFYLTQTGEYDVVIQFLPQRYVLFGGIISLLALAASAAYGLRGIVRNWKAKT
ncbi:MAG: hypothetical protein HYX81_02195 [Chloroflexi bacterium]|nr:hypothetical protein [Chloroflexota bacterium]